MNRPVTITIDVFAVEGMDGNHAAALGGAFEAALGELIETKGLPRTLAQPGEQPAIEIEIPTGVHGTSKIATTMAEMLYRRLDE